ncbi:MAG: C10 family peptidase [Bacteroidales bacterium]|nr:C10 family peptidase [Bacteroidales bacterium]
MKNAITLLGVMMMVVQLHSQPVSREDAVSAARSFWYEHVQSRCPVTLEGIKTGAVHEVCHEGRLVYYAVNLHPEGFVIVSAFRAVHPVFAYSFGSTYNEGNQHPPFKAWMGQYAGQVIHAIETNAVPTSVTVREWERLLRGDVSALKVIPQGDEVEPLLISTWNQGLYYNQMCPDDPAGPGGHCVTGCVATAMGQICYYFRHPLTGSGSYTYTHPEYGVISADFGNTYYRFEEMTNSLNEPELSAATLLFHMGVAVDMDYGPDGSGMWNHKAAYALRTHFRYSPETQYVYRDSTSLTWDSLIIAHLDQGIPLYYAGWSEPNVSGHAFVCDGYQTPDYFHFNWGWGGSYDGYFYLDNLSPGGSNFNLAQELIIHCFPDTASNTYPVYCNGGDTLTALCGTIDDGSGPAYHYQNSSSCSWLIDPQSTDDSVTCIKMEFNRLDTEPAADVITLYDGPDTSSPVLGTYSGSTLPPGQITSSGNRVLVTFTSSGSNSFPGWFLSYKTDRPVWCAGLTTLSDPEGCFGDGSGTFDYNNNSACMWKIDPPPMNGIQLEFIQFSTEPDKDVVKVYDGVTNQLLGTFSGYNTPPTIVAYNNGKLFVTFMSNPYNTEGGFEACYWALTDIPDTGTQGVPAIFITADRLQGWLRADISIAREQTLHLRMISLQGAVLAERLAVCHAAENIIILDIPQIPPGIYVLQVSGTDFTLSRKIIVN